MKSSFDIRLQLKELERRILALTAQRKKADLTTRDAIKRLMCAVKADPREGENGVLYAAMSFVSANQIARPTHV